jgi:hypothetical protein
MTEKPLFQTGQVLCTPKAWGEIKRYKADIPTFLKRHVLGDWDNMNEKITTFPLKEAMRFVRLMFLQPKASKTKSLISKFGLLQGKTDYPL